MSTYERLHRRRSSSTCKLLVALMATVPISCDSQSRVSHMPATEQPHAGVSPLAEANVSAKRSAPEGAGESGEHDEAAEAAGLSEEVEQP